jgi:hypothetical protein
MPGALTAERDEVHLVLALRRIQRQKVGALALPRFPFGQRYDQTNNNIKDIEPDPRAKDEPKPRHWTFLPFNSRYAEPGTKVPLKLAQIVVLRRSAVTKYWCRVTRDGPPGLCGKSLSSGIIA